MTRYSVLPVLMAAILTAGCSTTATSCCDDHSHASHSQAEHASGLIAVPSALREEHELLHAELAAAVDSGGDTGAAARVLRDRLHGHFEEEDTIALPPLGLLELLADGQVTPEMAPAVEMGRQVEERYDRYLREHQGIVDALDELEAAARAEGKPEQIAFARRLRLHAATEEQVLYPATIVIGRYIEAHLAQTSHDSVR